MVDRGKTPRHADQYRDRASRLAALARGVRLADLKPGRKAEARERSARILADAMESARLSDLIPERVQSALNQLRDAGYSNQTANFYRAALRAFVRWCDETGRTRDNPLRGVKGFNVEEDIRHVRRTLTETEFVRLIVAAENGPTLFGMPGPLRAMAYRLATATGFRADELRSLTPESFHLDGPDPTIYLKASATKNHHPANQPIPLALASELSRWLADKPARVSVLPLHVKTAQAIRRDLAATGIPYETEEGVADFHALRGYYVGALIEVGASISEVRALARHAKPETTLKHYARVSIHDMRGVVESLPDPTGADSTHGNTLAPLLPQSGGTPSQGLSVAGIPTDATHGTRDKPETPTNQGSGLIFKGSEVDPDGPGPRIGMPPDSDSAYRDFVRP
jgi:integrase